MCKSLRITLLMKPFSVVLEECSSKKRKLIKREKNMDCRKQEIQFSSIGKRVWDDQQRGPSEPWEFNRCLQRPFLDSGGNNKVLE
jgi:hypothetical protein